VFCVEEVLNATDYIFVLNGDVVGVVLPSSNLIPVVSSNPGDSSLMKHNHSVNLSSLLTSELISFPGFALHLYANLGKLKLLHHAHVQEKASDWQLYCRE